MIPEAQRVAITGMAINTPLGDTLGATYAALLEGRSALSAWQSLDVSRIEMKIGGDLGSYDIAGKVAAWSERLPATEARRLRQLIRRAPWSTRLSLLLALACFADAGLPLDGTGRDGFGAVVAGHNINAGYYESQVRQFDAEPAFIDPFLGLHALDTDHAGCVSELLRLRGPTCSLGAACASGNMALQTALDWIRYHGASAVLAIGAVFDISPSHLQSMSIMGAVASLRFQDEPARASRPFDRNRCGFVPTHGGAALLLEPLAAARTRGARIYGEVLSVAVQSDASHLTNPSEEGQARTMRAALDAAGVAPEEIDFISAHATSTPAGDLSEVRAIKGVFGAHASRLKVNAPKSMLGHTCWSSAIVETVLACLQMQGGVLHPSINLDALDEEIDLDVCPNKPVTYRPQTILKNAFGFGGINGVAVLRAFP